MTISKKEMEKAPFLIKVKDYWTPNPVILAYFQQTYGIPIEICYEIAVEEAKKAIDKEYYAKKNKN